MTEIVNINDEKPDFWITRSTIFGNPYEIGRDGTREEVIDKFKIWFGHLLKDKRFVNELEKLRDKKLGCFCKSKTENIKCHGDIYVEYFNNNPKPENILKRVGVIGSRDWPDNEFIFNILNKNKHKISCIVSGGAKGVDTSAVEWAIKNGINYSVWPAMWHDPITGEFNKSAGFVRNHYIVNDSDVILAFRYKNSNGTSHTIEITNKIGKPIRIFEKS